ncbi:hypothetical protein M408DRAFT_96439 [Serendipita vermifera MAFF 305830]|uniref:serine--tRNA ligase n=1 Tax=Serendipita vermifera MAFF 305830 TaxID=933852 RepID=A0A0C3BSU7_SERVB|nr:hypothetical protein M408DRAFT_96439 [Serendipita vermifera MAFF 305830]
MLFGTPKRPVRTCTSLRFISSSLSCCKHKGPLPVEPPTSQLHPPRLNYKSIVENAAYHKRNIKNRRIPQSNDVVKNLVAHYTRHTALMREIEEARKQKNLIGERFKKEMTPYEKSAALKEAAEIKAFLAIQQPLAMGTQTSLLELGLRIPNITHPDSPIGSELHATTLSTHGSERLEPNSARDHWKIAQELDLVNFDDAAVVTGSSWYYLQGAAALLEHALVNYALSIAVRHGYTPMTTPDVVRSDIATRCGFSPRDQSDEEGNVIHHFYHIAGSSTELVLAGTAEIPLAGMFTRKTFLERQLPRRVVSVGHAFRSEAGSRGAETRGLYRVHQFTKVELFAVTEQEQSDAMMEEIRNIQIEIFEGLGFPFRVLDMPTEELGHAAYRKYDMEAWMPGRGTWGEISSTSNCLDFQARRLHINYRPNRGPDDATEASHSSLPFAHTLNGTAAAIPRLIIALLENGVQLNEADQAVGLTLPKVLRPFWLGGDSLGPSAKITWVDIPPTSNQQVQE